MRTAKRVSSASVRVNSSARITHTNIIIFTPVLPRGITMKKALLLLLVLQLWALSADASVKYYGWPTQRPATDGGMQELSGFISPFLSWRFNSGPGSLWPGNIPIFPHTNYPSTPVFIDKDGEDPEGTREPLQPDTDDVLNPEIGLQEFSLAQAEDTKSENTFSLAQFNINDMMNELFRGPKPSRWWEGPHVCVRRTIKKTNADDEAMEQLKSSPIIRSVSSNTCTLAAGTYECILSQMVGDRQVTTTTTFECCPGYENSFKGTCEKVDILPMMESIMKMDATQFIYVLDGKEDYIKKENVTLFLPSNEAFEKFSNHMLETNNINLWVGSVDPVRRRRDVDDLNEMTSLQMLESHLVSGVHKIKPGDSLRSLTNSSLNVQEAYTSTGDSILLVNCAKVVSPNVATKGGMIHQVDHVLMPVKKSLIRILKDTPELSNFYESLQRSGLDEFISDDEDWTIFAPTNKAFDDLDPVFQNQLYDGNSSCAINLLKHHITPEPLCSLTAEGKTIRIGDSLNEIMVMSGTTVQSDASGEADKSGETVFTINNVKVIRPDLVGTNGVIHIIEEVMVTEAAFPISNLLEKKNLTQFLGIIERAGLKNEMDSWSDVTLFIPTDVAIETFLKKAGNNRMKNVLEYEDYTSTTPLDKHSKRDLKNFVLHHITKGNLKSCGMEDNSMLDTLDRSQLRTNLYSTLPPFVNTYNRATVNCARLLHFDTQQCDNVLHQIDRPLLNIDGTILDLIKAHPELSMLHKVVTGSDMEAILRDKKDITFVAPVNEAFQAMENAEYEELLGDKQTVTSLLTRHTFKDVRCCAGLHNFPWTASLTCIDDKFTAQFRDNQIGSATIKKCDLMASNGVVHLTNKIMFKHMRPRSKNPNIDILLYGL